jgi:hypothetical protein
MGIPDNVVHAYRAAPGAATFFSLETKCKGGMLHLGHFDKDLAKWQACAALHLMTFAAWTPQGLVFGYVNREGEGASILVVTKMLMWSSSNCPNDMNTEVEVQNYMRICSDKARKYLSSHMKPLVEVQTVIGTDRPIFNGAMPALDQTNAQHLPWGDTVACIDVGFEGRGVVALVGERRFGCVVGDSRNLHTDLDNLMRFSVLDRQVRLYES